jgi:hypothetical protein
MAASGGITMKKYLVKLCLVFLAYAVTWSVALAQEIVSEPLPPCEPGYTYVPETQVKEVERYVCKLVPYTKQTKKWVYSQKDAPFCIHKSGKLGWLCCFDPGCQGPFQRKLLVKTEIVVKEEPATRCVVEKTIEKVPCTVYRKVPLTGRRKQPEASPRQDSIAGALLQPPDAQTPIPPQPIGPASHHP